MFLQEYDLVNQHLHYFHVLIVHFVDVRWIRVGPDGLKIDAVVSCACVGSDLDILCLALCIFDELLLLRLLGVVFCQ